jgi:prolyl-tRNA synthetase
MSPFNVTLLVLNPKNSDQVTATAESLYLELQQAGLDVLLDDRDARPGVKFAEADLLGVPHRIVIGERGLKDGVVEYRHRRSGSEDKVALNDAVTYLQQRSEARPQD